MKKIKQAIAAFLVTALMIQPGVFVGGMSEVHASEVEPEVHEQMKVTDISVRGMTMDFNKDAIEIGDNGVNLTVDVAVNVPVEWAVSEISVGWYAVSDDEYYEFISEKYNVAAQPEDGIYSLEFELDKYASPDTYYLSDVSVEFIKETDADAFYELYGETTEYYKVASSEDPVEFEWTAYGEKSYYDLSSTKYAGTADYTVTSATGKDSKVPLITKLEMKSADVLYSGEPTEISLTFFEKTSGIKSINVLVVTPDDEGYEEFEFTADGMEKYTGTQTITLTSPNLDVRSSGHYSVYAMYIEDYAGNHMEYYVDDDEENLIGYEEQKNSDGTSSEVTHKIDNISYSVCNGHSYVDGVTKATTSKNGSTYKECEYCGEVKEGSKKTVHYIKSIKLSQMSFVYNGKVRKPTVSVYDSKGNKISSSNYKVTYPSGRKNVGSYKVKIVFKGNYKGTVYKTFTIKPKSTSITSLSGGRKQFKVKWKKQTTQMTGYQIRYSTDSDFETYKSKIITTKKYTSSTVKNLKADKKYYVKIRTYKTVKVDGESKKIYSAWSKVKTVKTR